MHGESVELSPGSYEYSAKNASLESLNLPEKNLDILLSGLNIEDVPAADLIAEINKPEIAELFERLRESIDDDESKEIVSELIKKTAH